MVNTNSYSLFQLGQTPIGDYIAHRGYVPETKDTPVLKRENPKNNNPLVPNGDAPWNLAILSDQYFSNDQTPHNREDFFCSGVLLNRRYVLSLYSCMRKLQTRSNGNFYLGKNHCQY